MLTLNTDSCSPNTMNNQRGQGHELWPDLSTNIMSICTIGSVTWLSCEVKIPLRSHTDLLMQIRWPYYANEMAYMTFLWADLHMQIRCPEDVNVMGRVRRYIHMVDISAFLNIPFHRAVWMIQREHTGILTTAIFVFSYYSQLAYVVERKVLTARFKWHIRAGMYPED